MFSLAEIHGITFAIWDDTMLRNDKRTINAVLLLISASVLAARIYGSGPFEGLFENVCYAEPFWGSDKALHFGVGGAIGGATYGALWITWDNLPILPRVAMSMSMGTLVGLGKEVYDAGRDDNVFSGFDLLWTFWGSLLASSSLGFLEWLVTPSGPTIKSDSSSRVHVYIGERRLFITGQF